MYLNLHSHSPAKNGETVIQSLSGHYETAGGKGLFSLGIHPWYIADPPLVQWESLQRWAGLPQVVAIGECGLDKVCTTPFSLQEMVFRDQIRLAATLKKPLIIHCVRAWEEVFSLLQSAHPGVPVVFHGYAKNAELALRIINKGYYISFGKALSTAALQETLRNIPPDRFFLETDDSMLEIATVYQWAAEALAIDGNSLSLQLQNNARTVFGPAFPEL